MRRAGINFWPKLQGLLEDNSEEWEKWGGQKKRAEGMGLVQKRSEEYKKT